MKIILNSHEIPLDDVDEGLKTREELVGIVVKHIEDFAQEKVHAEKKKYQE